MEISTNIPIRLERLKKSLKDKYALNWTDFLVLCALVELENDSIYTETPEIHKYLGKDRNWVYKSLRKLRKRELINVYERESIFEPWIVSVNGMGRRIVNNSLR